MAVLLKLQSADTDEALIMKRGNEPAAIRELHRIREEMLAEEKRVGSDTYWAEANQRAQEFARRRGLKCVESPAATAVRERPGKYKTKQR